MKESTYSELVERIGRLVVEMHARLDDPFAVEDWAARFCMSPYHFQRVFTRIAGENLAFMFRRLRMERAAYELQHSSRRITDVALRAGFAGPEAFSKAFRRAYGESASEFRASDWNSHWRGTPSSVHYVPDGVPEFRPLARTGTEANYRLASVPPFKVFARRHYGYSGYIGKSLRALTAEIEGQGLDWQSRPIYTFARRLRRYIAVSAIEAYVAVPPSLAVAEGLEKETLGGFDYLAVPFRDELRWLGDFWFRVWVEILPASGVEPIPAPVYQEIRFGTVPDNPRYPQIDIYIPVRAKKRILGKIGAANRLETIAP